VLVWGLAGAAGGARAVDDPPAAGAAGSPGKAASLHQAVAKALAGPAPAAAADTPTLRFRRSAAVQARERTAMLSRIEATGGEGSGLHKAVASDRILETFDRLLRRYGYSPDHLGDATAAFLVLAWEVVNDADATREPEGARAVRRQIGPAMATVAPFAGMDDAGKQAQAQRVAYMAMVASTNRQVFKAAGDARRLAALQQEVRAQVRTSLGVDLERYRLTAGGLVPR
jgi:hypothetical protein